MSSAYWNYFISLEKDFIRTLDFIELTPANAATYGDNFAKLILAAGSEVDVICKALCDLVAPGSRPQNIWQYKGVVTQAFPKIHTAEIMVQRNGQVIVPWASWDPEIAKSPEWWSAYNHIKHDRVANFALASQENALNSLCGLLVLNRYYHRAAGDIGHPEPFPDLLDAGTPAYIVESGYRTLAGL